MNNTCLKTLLAAALLLPGGSVLAAGFGLEAVCADEVRAARADSGIPAVAAPAAEEMVGVDMSVRVPYDTLKKAVLMVAASEKRLAIVNPAAPVVSKSGEFLKISNIRVDQGGIAVLPTLTLKPYLETVDTLVVRVQRVQLRAEMESDVKSAPPAVDREQVMEQVMGVMIKGVYGALNNFLKRKQVPMKAEDIVKMDYDKAGWALRVRVSSKVVDQFVPPGLVGEMHLTGFAVADTGIMLKIQTPR